jgi:hypothetical protein
MHRLGPEILRFCILYQDSPVSFTSKSGPSQSPVDWSGLLYYPGRAPRCPPVLFGTERPSKQTYVRLRRLPCPSNQRSIDKNEGLKFRASEAEPHQTHRVLAKLPSDTKLSCRLRKSGIHLLPLGLQR